MFETTPKVVELFGRKARLLTQNAVDPPFDFVADVLRQLCLVPGDRSIDEASDFELYGLDAGVEIAEIRREIEAPSHQQRADRILNRALPFGQELLEVVPVKRIAAQDVERSIGNQMRTQDRADGLFALAGDPLG